MQDSYLFFTYLSLHTLDLGLKFKALLGNVADLWADVGRLTKECGVGLSKTCFSQMRGQLNVEGTHVGQEGIEHPAVNTQVKMKGRNTHPLKVDWWLAGVNYVVELLRSL